MTKLIDAELPEGLDFTVPSRFMQAKFPMRTNYHPTTGALITECAKYKMNWLAVWCMGYVLCGEYHNSEALLMRNQWKLETESGKLQRFRTWAEGMQAGVQFLCALMGILPQLPIIWPHGVEVAKKYEKKFKELKDFDAHYGEGFAAEVEAVYVEFVAFIKKDDVKLPEPVVVSPVPPLPPLPPPVIVEPEPVKETKPTKPGSKYPWQVWLGGVLSALAIPWWFLEKFLPGWAGLLWEFLKKIAETSF